MGRVSKARFTKKISEIKGSSEYENNISLSFRDSIDDLITLVEYSIEGPEISSKTSHQAPSKDEFHQKNKQKQARAKEEPQRSPGGQPGRKGSNLKQVENPDEIVSLEIDLRTLPAGCYEELEPETRQVFEIVTKRKVIEYRSQRVRGEDGKIYAAEFPEDIKIQAQYGKSVRAYVLGLAHEQLIPYERITTHMESLFGFSMSQGTIVNWEEKAEAALEPFRKRTLRRLKYSKAGYFDETGVSINGILHWVHVATDGKVALFFPHKKRGKEAMDKFGILPGYQGIAHHDFWKPYFRYNCQHSLCNAHIIRELKAIFEGGQQWAGEMLTLLQHMNEEKKAGTLTPQKINSLEESYDKILTQGLRKNPGTKQKGIRRTKARCLLDRLRDHKHSFLLFLRVHKAQFTNNQAERIIRMFKVEMKISGTYKTLQTAKRALLIRSYLTTSKNMNINSDDALKMIV